MGVHGTFCRLCGLPTQHDHYVPTRSGMLKIYRGASPGGGHEWEPGEAPFAFGPEHAWLMDAVVLPWDDHRIRRGAVEDGVLDGVMVLAGDEDGLAYHHLCWQIEGEPASTGPAIRADGTHGWALVEGYQEQLFDFQGLAADGKAWMLDEPAPGTRSRARIEALLGVARDEVTAPAKSLEEILALDRDWACMSIRGRDGARMAIARARTHAIQDVPKQGYGELVHLTIPYPSSALPGEGMNELEQVEIAVKSAVEADAAACLACVTIARGRYQLLTYARDGARTRAAIEALPVPPEATLEVIADPSWAVASSTLANLTGVSG